ncbi:MAG: hypothetical protein GF329_18205 [Candidatus Lokiarchaeota archaeon]|nr:hypothetical protein [Candidatus Lokiarchaeota archaeon]
MSDKEYKKIEFYDDLLENINKKIKFKGKISEIPWQHLININKPYENINYVDIMAKESKKPSQIVVYTKEEAPGPGSRIIFYGTVKKTSGKSKRPGSDKTTSEIQINAEKFKVIEEKRSIDKKLH